jgi:hypothetical protein
MTAPQQPVGVAWNPWGGTAGGLGVSPTHLSVWITPTETVGR